MKTVIALTVVSIMLVSCDLSNQEIVDETAFCEEHGMIPAVKYNGLTGQVYKIICLPPHRGENDDSH